MWIDEATLELGPEIGEGGEGEIFTLLNRSGEVFKRHTIELTPAIVAKLEWMVANLPAVEAQQRLTWPTALVRGGDGQLSGYLMRRLPDKRVTIQAVYGQDALAFQTLDRPPFDLKHRLIVARNLATVVAACHNHGYVVGDLNHNNVLVDANGHVTLVDNDSFQIRTPDGRVHLFNGGVAPGYASPELRPLPAHVPPSHDIFLVTLLVFRLLMDSIHPFQGLSEVPAGEDPPDEIALLRQRVYPYDLQRRFPGVRPSPQAPALGRLHRDIVDAFQRCFTDGLGNPALRPSLDDWTRILDAALEELGRCRRGHWYSGDRDWCLQRDEQGGYCASTDTHLGGAFPPDQVDALTGQVDMPPTYPFTWATDARGLPFRAGARWELRDSAGWALDGGALRKGRFRRTWEVPPDTYTVRVVAKDGTAITEDRVDVTGPVTRYREVAITPPVRPDRRVLERVRGAVPESLRATWRRASGNAASVQATWMRTWGTALARAATFPARAFALAIVALLVVHVLAEGGVVGLARDLMPGDPTPGPESIEPLQPTETEGPATGTTWVMIANADGDRVWLNEGPNRKELKLYDEGTVLQVLDPEPVQAGDYWWLNVKAPDGLEGWIAVDFIAPSGSD